MSQFRSTIVAAAAVVQLTRPAFGQLPSAPVLQNVWADAGMVGAFNAGGGSGQSVYAAAAAWTPPSGRFQLSGGLGVQSRTGDGGSGVAYGARIALPFGRSRTTFAFAAFAGVGGGNGRHAEIVDTIHFVGDSITSDTTWVGQAAQIPIGVAVGWRRSFGQSRGVSVYLSPSIMFLAGRHSGAALPRVGLGADFGITQSIGITGGLDLGRPATDQGGPSGAIYGLGVAYAFGRR